MSEFGEALRERCGRCYRVIRVKQQWTSIGIGDKYARHGERPDERKSTVEEWNDWVPMDCCELCAPCTNQLKQWLNDPNGKRRVSTLRRKYHGKQVEP